MGNNSDKKVGFVTVSTDCGSMFRKAIPTAMITSDYRISAVAKSSDPMAVFRECGRRSPERRFDGLASLEVKRTCCHLARNQSDKTFGNQYKLRRVIDRTEAADQIRMPLDIPVVYFTGYSETIFLAEPKRPNITGVSANRCL